MYLYVTWAVCKNVNKARKAFKDCDPNYIVRFFDSLTSLIKDFNIGASEVWNEDKASIRIGVLY